MTGFLQIAILGGMNPMLIFRAGSNHRCARGLVAGLVVAFFWHDAPGQMVRGVRLDSGTLTNLNFPGKIELRLGSNKECNRFETNRLVRVPASVVDLRSELKAIVKADYSGASNGSVTNFGDIVLRFQQCRGDEHAIERVWQEMKTNAPEVYGQVVHPLSSLIDQRGSHSLITNKFGIEDLPDDGFLHGKSGQIKGRGDLGQIATLVFFDTTAPSRPVDWKRAIQTLKQQDLALTNYPSRRGLESPYLKASLKDAPILCAEVPSIQYCVEYLVDISRTKPKGLPTDRMTIATRSRESVDSDGCWITEYYGLGHVNVVFPITALDFQGDDSYIPVIASGGQFVAVLIVTRVVASGESPWRLIRENLGSLRLQAESTGGH